MKRNKVFLIVAVALALIRVFGGACCENKKKAEIKRAHEAAQSALSALPSAESSVFKTGQELFDFFKSKNAFKYEPVIMRNLKTALNAETYEEAKPVLVELDGKVKKHTNLGNNPDYQQLWKKLEKAMINFEVAYKKFDSAVKTYHTLVYEA